MKRLREAEKEETRVELSSESWIIVRLRTVKCTEEEFTELWNLHPTTRDNIKLFGKLIPIPRFQRLYGDSSYKYSGVELQAEPELPEIVRRCVDYAKVNYAKSSKGKVLNWNGALVNWYPDGMSYIGAHSDDERDLEPEAPILSFSFGAVRTFRVKNKKTGARQDFATEHCSVIVMGGAMQREFKHEITKTVKPVGPRINVTVRCFGAKD